MFYKFKHDKEIKRCIECPFVNMDQYGAYGCKLINDYLQVDEEKEIDERCKLIKVN